MQVHKERHGVHTAFDDRGCGGHWTGAVWFNASVTTDVHTWSFVGSVGCLSEKGSLHVQKERHGIEHTVTQRRMRGAWTGPVLAVASVPKYARPWNFADSSVQ